MAKQNKCDNDSNNLKQEQAQLKNEHEELESSLLESVLPYGIFTFTDVDPDVIKDELAAAS